METQKITDASVAQKTMPEKNAMLYKRELLIAVIGSIVAILMGNGNFLMLVNPEYFLNTIIWGFPFSYWYQLVIAWLGMIALGWIITEKLAKVENEIEDAEKE